MTVSVRVISAGQGHRYRYLLTSVAVGDGDMDSVSALTRYCTETGTPPGRWLGTGVTGLAGRISRDDEVNEQQLRLLLGAGNDSATGEPLGRPYRLVRHRSATSRASDQQARRGPFSRRAGPPDRAD